jgi:site-specific recombinase XerC
VRKEDHWERTFSQAAGPGLTEQEFKRYLSQERGLSTPTLANYLPFVHQLLLERYGNGPIDFGKLSAKDILRFVQRHARDHSPGRAGPMAAALCAFLQHLRYRGEITTDLAACVPTVANWSHATLPKFLKPGQVDQVLKHCDRRCATGRRDYAILLLLARLGLRAGEVSALTLDDIDCEEGSLAVLGKGGREVKLPLPAEVGEAIVDYLQNGRPHCVSRGLFLRQRAPRVELTNHAIKAGFQRDLYLAELPAEILLSIAGSESRRTKPPLDRNFLSHFKNGDDHSQS